MCKRLALGVVLSKLCPIGKPMVMKIYHNITHRVNLDRFSPLERKLPDLLGRLIRPRREVEQGLRRLALRKDSAEVEQDRLDELVPDVIGDERVGAFHKLVRPQDRNQHLFDKQSDQIV